MSTDSCFSLWRQLLVSLLYHFYTYLSFIVIELNILVHPYTHTTYTYTYVCLLYMYKHIYHILCTLCTSIVNSDISKLFPITDFFQSIL